MVSGALSQSLPEFSEELSTRRGSGVGMSGLGFRGLQGRGSQPASRRRNMVGVRNEPPNSEAASWHCSGEAEGLLRSQSQDHAPRCPQNWRDGAPSKKEGRSPGRCSRCRVLNRWFKGDEYEVSYWRVGKVPSGRQPAGSSLELGLSPTERRMGPKRAAETRPQKGRAKDVLGDPVARQRADLSGSPGVREPWAAGPPGPGVGAAASRSRRSRRAQQQLPAGRRARRDGARPRGEGPADGPPRAAGAPPADVRAAGSAH